MKKTLKQTEEQKRRKRRTRTQTSTGNVFADLGFEDAEERLLKAKLASKIAQLIQEKGWTQAQTAERIALDQPKVSRLLRGQLSGFSADRLFAVLNRLGHSVEVRISAQAKAPKKSHIRVTIG